MINSTAAFLQVTSLKVIHIHSYFHDQGIGNNNEFDKKKKKEQASATSSYKLTCLI